MKVTAIKGTQRVAINVGQPVWTHGMTVKVKFCSCCLCTGHSNDECPIRQCFRCGQFGHVGRDCATSGDGDIQAASKDEEEEIFRNFRRKGSFFNRHGRDSLLRGGTWKRACGKVKEAVGGDCPGGRLLRVPKVQEKARDADAETDPVGGRADDPFLRVPGVRQQMEAVVVDSSRIPADDFECGKRSVVF